MLVLTRKQRETIQVGSDVVITIVRITDGSVRIGIEAPKHIPVIRGELVLVQEQDDGGIQEPSSGE